MKQQLESVAPPTPMVAASRNVVVQESTTPEKVSSAGSLVQQHTGPGPGESRSGPGEA